MDGEWRKRMTILDIRFRPSPHHSMQEFQLIRPWGETNLCILLFRLCVCIVVCFRQVPPSITISMGFSSFSSINNSTYGTNPSGPSCGRRELEEDKEKRVVSVQVLLILCKWPL